MADSTDKKKNIDELLAAVDRGEKNALDRLVTAIYPDLKKLAHFHSASERPGHTLNTTAIVHEAFERLVAGNRNWTDRQHFLRAAAKVMRHLLVDYARRRNAGKRGSGRAALTLEDDRYTSDDDSLAVLVLDSAMKDIAEIDPRLEQIIECRYFAGLTVVETAEALGMAVRTVERDWHRARGYIRKAMETDVS
ncbi:MAG: sigma-70 family RNA polymerase sigma factor [Desulfobulbaceae bacterium]|nr:sigma-70 family RNA polymerase sigma factor [Desulfobulbaceae bacterium]